MPIGAEVQRATAMERRRFGGGDSVCAGLGGSSERIGDAGDREAEREIEQRHSGGEQREKESEGAQKVLVQVGRFVELAATERPRRTMHNTVRTPAKFQPAGRLAAALPPPGTRRAASGASAASALRISFRKCTDMKRYTMVPPVPRRHDPSHRQTVVTASSDQTVNSFSETPSIASAMLPACPLPILSLGSGTQLPKITDSPSCPQYESLSEWLHIHIVTADATTVI